MCAITPSSMSKRTLQEMSVRSDAFIVTSSSTGLPEFGVQGLYTGSNEGYTVHSLASGGLRASDVQH